MQSGDKEETDKENEFVNIDDNNKDRPIPLVFGGSFSTISRGLKTKRIKKK
jgi:hypothetical protein